MTTGSLQQPTVKNSEWMPGAEVGWDLGIGGKKRAGDCASECRGPREEGTGVPDSCLGPKLLSTITGSTQYAWGITA